VRSSFIFKEKWLPYVHFGDLNTANESKSPIDKELSKNQTYLIIASPFKPDMAPKG